MKPSLGFALKLESSTGRAALELKRILSNHTVPFPSTLNWNTSDKFTGGLNNLMGYSHYSIGQQ